MEDANIIAVLVARREDTAARLAFSWTENAARYSQLPLIARTFVNEQSSPSESTLFPCLELTFDRPPKDPRVGYVIGTDPEVCDVYVGKGSQSSLISRRHCSIQLDERGRVKIVDFSVAGTIVSHDGQGSSQRRRSFSWLVSLQFRRVRVALAKGSITFDIVLPQIGEQLAAQYSDNVRQYLRSIPETLANPFRVLALDNRSRSTNEFESLSGARIFLKLRMLQVGTSARVHECFDVGSGKTYAGKYFENRQMVDVIAEVNILRQLSHDRIVALEDFIWHPLPCLIMENSRLGDLLSQQESEALSDHEWISFLVQALEALSYLHGRTPPVVHRDIKASNFVVQSRSPLQVKLIDFGNSAVMPVAGLLTEQVGAADYQAPEMLAGKGYGPACDMWQLGLVPLRHGDMGFPYVLHNYEGPDGPEGWARGLVDVLEELKHTNIILNFLQGSMLQHDPQNRESAKTALRIARRIESDWDSE